MTCPDCSDESPDLGLSERLERLARLGAIGSATWLRRPQALTLRATHCDDLGPDNGSWTANILRLHRLAKSSDRSELEYHRKRIRKPMLLSGQSTTEAGPPLSPIRGATPVRR